MPKPDEEQELARLRAAEETCFSLLLAVGLGMMEEVPMKTREFIASGGFDEWARLAEEQGLLRKEDPDAPTG